MDFSYGAGASPLEARTNIAVYASILVAIIIVTVFAVIAIVLKIIKDKHSSPEYIEKEKNRLTKYNDIKLVKQTYGFTQAEADLLWEICKAVEPTNIYYLLRDNYKVDALFREAYEILKQIKASEQKFSDFFMLRYRMEVALSQTTKITSSTQIPVNSVIFLLVGDGEQFPFTLVKNSRQNMALEIPEFLYSSPHQPEILKRIKFMYRTATFTTYFFISRPIRYEKTPDGKFIMYAAHTNNMESLKQRHTRREFENEMCTFSAVKELKEGGKTFYKASERKYPAKLANISIGGCCLHTKLPLKEKQTLCIFFPSLGIKEDTVGIIRHTRKLPGIDLYALHIEFIQIKTSVENRIFSFVYKFEL